VAARPRDSSLSEVTEDRRRSIYAGPWRVDIVTRAGVDVPVPASDIARRVQRALEVSGAPEPGSVTVVLADDEELQDLNREHMGHDGPTDVLSFPMLPADAFPRHEAGERTNARAGPRTHIGDIAISVERAIEQAEIRRELDMTAIDDVLARADGRRGATALRTLLSEMQLGSTRTRNDLEEAFLAICRQANTPPDAVNEWIAYPEGGGAEADFVWRDQHLIAEVDGRATHLTARAFEHDRARDQRLATLGWRVVRFSWRQVETEPARVAATVSALHAAQTPWTTASTR